MQQYRGTSFWLDSLLDAGLDDLEPRASVGDDEHYDVAIVGAGFTGLWTAYYLSTLNPELKVMVLEAQIAGFGASGRNGGWCSALFPVEPADLVRLHGREPAQSLRRAMIDTVDEVGRIAALEGIECDFVKGGTVVFARATAQLARARHDAEEIRSVGVDPIDFHEVDGYRGITNVRSVTFDPSCARIHPAKLARGLARVVERHGVTIRESSRVIGLSPNSLAVSTASGVHTVTATDIVIATEAWGMPEQVADRRIMPLYSLVIATEPLSDATWDEIGIEHGQTFSDFRHLLIYGQRTADNRFVFGGRGARYHYGSAIEPEFDKAPRVFAHLRRALDELIPAAASAKVTHSWGGPLGVPRDWHASVGRDARHGVWRAGGYVGDGVATTNLAGRTLADLILGRTTDLVLLPWVDHESRQWESEPWRYLGANGGLLATTFADSEEAVTHRQSLAAKLASVVTGR
jgi:glycine/D-amino acid oxidase-like deaminating enzyme